MADLLSRTGDSHDDPYERYNLSNCFLAALMGALIHWLGFDSPLTSPHNYAGAVAVFTIIGFIALAIVGQPLACRLDREGRATLINGWLIGASAGTLIPAALSYSVVLLLFGRLDFIFSPGPWHIGLMFGSVQGAVAGLALVWLGRRRDGEGVGLGEPAQPSATPQRGFRWEWMIIAVGLGLPLAVMTNVALERSSRPFPIGGEFYDWPNTALVLPPKGGKEAYKGSVHYRSSDRSPDEDAFYLLYRGDEQEALNEAGFPHLEWITDGFVKRHELFFRPTAAGLVVCSRESVKRRWAAPCGISFVHRGARWQLHFGAHRVRDAEQLHREAVARLERYRARAHD